MNTQAHRAEEFKPVNAATRLFSAALACVVGVGVIAAMVTGMAHQSGGQSLGEFVASHLAAEQPVLAAAPAGSDAS